MIKIYSKEELGVELYESDVAWSYPLNELDYVLENNTNDEEFIYHNGRLYEKECLLQDLSIYIDMADMPSKLREYEGNEERKQILYRMYCVNPDRQEMCNISLKELIDYIIETDQYWEQDRYIVRECARLCGASEELLNKIDSYGKEEQIKCPLCGEPLKHEEENGTHLYKCEQCPIVGMEYIEQKDINNMFNNLMKNYKNDEEDYEEEDYE